MVEINYTAPLGFIESDILFHNTRKLTHFYISSPTKSIGEHMRDK